MYEFKTDVRLSLLDTPPEILTEGRPPFDLDHRALVEIRWSVEFEMREHGIKSIIVSIPPQSIEFEIEREEGEVYDTEEIRIDLTEVSADLSGRPDHDMLIPSYLEFFKGQWTLVF